MLQAAGMGVAFEGKPLLLAKMAIHLIILISAACHIFKAIKSMISLQIKFRGSIYPIQIKGAETGPFVFDIKTWHLPFRIGGTAYFLAKLI